MKLVVDAGGLIAMERRDRWVMALLKVAWRSGEPPRTHGGVVAQVWRGAAGRHAMLARGLGGMRVEPLDDELGRRAGMLLGRSSTSDAVDAALVLLAVDGDTVLTSDPGDLEALAVAAAVHVDLVAV